MAARLIITIDGPAGTGKSTVAHLLAARLGLEFLDTGAMYRAATLLALDHDISPDDGPRLSDLLAQSDLHFDWTFDPPRVLIGTRDVSERIRDPDVAESVSVVSSQPEIRAVLVAQQRRIAERHPRLVSEGRDQGSVVFPDARIRFFIEADVDVRARRRFDQLIAGGREVELEAIRREIAGRDQCDSDRAVGPLTRPEGGIVVDTSAMTLGQVVDHLERLVRNDLSVDAAEAGKFTNAERSG